jgi:hypothetical protein
VTINLQAASDSGSSSSDNITNATSLVFDVSFSEPVAGLAPGDFSNPGTATGCSFGVPAGGPTNYTETVTGCSAGTVILRLAAAGVTDTAGNTNAQTNGATVTIDRTAPTVTMNSVTNGNGQRKVYNGTTTDNSGSVHVVIHLGATIAGSVKDDVTGSTFPTSTTWTVTGTNNALSTGTQYTAEVTQTDVAGNVSGTATFTFNAP